jgi:hypothetical protein
LDFGRRRRFQVNVRQSPRGSVHDLFVRPLRADVVRRRRQNPPRVAKPSNIEITPASDGAPL